MATNYKKTNNKKQQNNNTPIYVLSAIATLLIVAIIILVAVSSCSGSDNAATNGTTDSMADTVKTQETDSMADKIAALNIEENPVATLTMEDGGVIVMELYPDIAPNTVCNFIELANSGFYDGVIFHRTTHENNMYVIQGGDPEGTGGGGPGYTIKGEFTNNGFKNDLKHERGVISMARRAQPLDSAGSQFFIMIEDCTYLDGDYATFGKVISGMEVADAIHAQETNTNDKPLVDQVIKSIRVDTKGIEYPKAEKIQ